MNKTAFLFPGQGAQRAGMGKDFYDNSSTAKDIFDRASVLLDMDMTELCFEKNDRLDMTEYTQAAMVTTCLAMAAVLKEKGYHADMTAGLSLGEYCAIAFAGGMSDEDAIALVRQRGIFMQECVPAGEGAMSAVFGMTREAIDACIKDMKDVYVANDNCPGQIVITGSAPAAAQAGEKLKAAGARRIVPLKVSGPFHSPYMIPAGEKLNVLLKKINWSPLKIPYVTNVTGEPVTDISLSEELLTRQVSSSVEWVKSVERMIEEGVDTFVEIGPGKTLTGFVKKINKDVKTINIQSWDDLIQLESR